MMEPQSAEKSLPPGMIGFVYIIWGWQTEHWFIAPVLIVLYEFSHIFNIQLTFTKQDLARLVDFCSLIFVAFSIYVAITEPSASAVFVVTEWLPVILFPLLAAQKYTNYKKIPLTALSMHLRKKGDNAKIIDMSYAFFIVCSAAASTGNQQGLIFFISMILVWSWFFIIARNTRFNLLIIVLLLPVLALGAFQFNRSLSTFQTYLEDHVPEWYLEFFKSKADPYHRSTALGYIGQLKLSDRIVLRVKPEGPPPSLLRVASYNRFGGNFWSARQDNFESFKISQPENPQAFTKVKIMMEFDDGEAVLPLPIGSKHIWDLPTQFIGKNKLGTVKIKKGPDVAMYSVAFKKNQEVDFLPTPADLSVPKFYLKILDPFIEKYKLKALSNEALMPRLNSIFSTEFAYTLNIKSGEDMPPLADFLVNTKKGHCEYFASSTVLLLRRLGIPTRYASGFGVQEYSEMESLYVVRQSHAHAWAIAYINGHWVNVDTTPPDWSIIEQSPDSIGKWFSDMWSWLWAEIDQWRMDDSEDSQFTWVLLLIIPLLLFLLKRFKSVRLTRENKRANNNFTFQPIHDVLKIAEEHALIKQPGETMRAFFNKLYLHPQINAKETLKNIIDLYEQHQFDPDRKQSTLIKQYEEQVNNWLNAQNQ